MEKSALAGEAGDGAITFDFDRGDLRQSQTTFATIAGRLIGKCFGRLAEVAHIA
jgi:hypothetical protein